MKSETSTERAERIVRELRAVTTEAAGVLKDLRALVKEVRNLLPAEAHDAVARELIPSLESFSVMLVGTIHAAEVEIKDRFNETAEGIEALMMDLVHSGQIYKLGSPEVQGSKAVQALIDEAKRRNR